MKSIFDFSKCLLLILCIIQRINCKQSKHDGPPVIKEHPKDFLARRNEPATFNCASPNANKIEWYRNGEKIQKDDEGDSRSTRTMLFEGTLYFMRVSAGRKDNDAGTYWCVASNELGRTKSRNATLTIASLGTTFIQMPNSSVMVRQGDSLVLNCRPPKGVPGPTVIWKHNGQIVANNSRVRTSADGDLIFDDVIESDAGTYFCVAQNFVGSRESSAASVVVMSPPWFEERPKNLSIVAGATVELHCKAHGSPKPSVTWRRLDGKMPLERTQVKGENNLRISEVTAADSGMYVCEAKNEAGTAVTLGSLKVVVAPEVKEKPNNALSLVGDSLILRCKVEGDPLPLLVWRLPHEDQNILLSGGQNSNHASVSQNGSVLNVKKLKIEDTGDYYCWGISSGGGVSSRAEVVVVESLPPPLIGIRPQDQYAPLGATVSFPCEVASEASEAKIVWWFQKAAHLPAQQLVNKRSVTQIQTGTLVIKHISAEDAGIYKCKATSKSGSVEAEAILRVTENAQDYEESFSSITTLPAPPSKPRITYYNSTSIHLTWLPNSRRSFNNAEYYTIEYWRSPWQEWRVAKADVTETTTIITDLSPNTAYIFLIRTINDNGESFPSPWSDMIYTSTVGGHGVLLEDEKQTRRKLNRPNVSLLSAKAISSSSVVLSWELLEGSELELDGVIVYSVGDKSIDPATIFGTSSTSHTVRDLRPNTPYTFFLIPFWKTIEGVPSNSQTLVTPEEAPEVAPTGISVEVFESGTTLIKWDPLKKSEARGNIIGYRVSITHNRTNTIKETQNAWLEAQGLTEGHLYTVKVAAVSGGGVGPWSSPELIDIAGIPPVGRQDASGKTGGEVPSVFFPPPHPIWILYLIVPLVILCIIVILLYLRKVRRKSPPSSLDAPLGPALYSSSGVYGPTHQVNMYGEQKLWRPSDSDQDSSLSSARLLRPEHLANEYAEPRIQRLTDSTEPYATTALLAPASPRNCRTSPSWHHSRCTDDIQVNWAALLPPPPTCPPPLNFPSHNTEGGETCSSVTTSDSGDRRHYHTGSSSQYENAGGSEQYERPCDVAVPCDIASEHTYAVYTPVAHDVNGDTFQTFSTLQAKPLRRVKVDLRPAVAEPPKSNTH